MKVTIRQVTDGDEEGGELHEFKDSSRVEIGGEDSQADFRLPGGHGSYAEICFDGKCYRLDARRGGPSTMVNGRRVESVKLVNGDVVEFGDHGPKLQLSFELEVPDAALAPKTARLHQRLVRLRRRNTVALVALGALALASVYLFVRQEEKVQELLDAEEAGRQQAAAETHRLDQTLAELQARFEGQADSRLQQEEAARRSQAEVERLRQAVLAESQSMLEVRLQELDQARRDDNEEAMGQLRHEIGGLRTELGQNAPVSRVLQGVLARNDSSVVLLYIEVDYLIGTPGGDVTRTASGWGSGFFVTDEGHVITNKHVVQPWKFDVELSALEAKGLLSVAADGVRIAAWPGGSLAFDEDGEPDFEQGFNNHQLHNLRLLRTAEDSLEMRALMLPDGSRLEVPVHQNDNHDLALLQAEGAKFRPVRIKTHTDRPFVRKLDPVMVIGFPQGRGILEARIAETSPSTGTIRKIEDTIYVTASIIPGNSGGPVFAADGEVIGIATRVFSETLGICIRIEHALGLLASATAE